MKRTQRNAAYVVTALIAVTAYGVFATGKTREAPPPQATTRATAGAPSLDDGALSTAQALVRYPTTAAELPLAQEALRIADQEMDLAFAYAVRQMALHPQAISAEAKAIQQRLTAALEQERRDSIAVDQWTAAVAHSRGLDAAQSDSLQLTKARLELDNDEIDDAHEDLIHAGGDPQGRMQAMVQAHEEASHRSDSTHINTTPVADGAGVVAIARRLSAIREKHIRLLEAIATADSSGNAFETRHHRLDSLVHDTAHVVGSQLADAQRRTQQQKSRAAVEKRADNEHRLATIYRAWVTELQGQERDIAHQALRSVLIILAIVLAWLLADAVLMRMMVSARMERRSLQRLRVVTRVAIQVLGVLLIFVVIFGAPSNLGTIIGLAGAGLTVALKDFIVSFVGWLVLMGRDGVRIGDLVEINGVTGEVVELGVFNTVLHETGNWTDAGHPTGRRVTFTNSYAIEGHYFNFSTSGQWLWDEVRIAVPASKDPAAVVAALQATVAEATADSARLAEAEWKASSHSPALTTITATPTVTIKPIMGGVELTVRFIAHAAERFQLRSKLYHAAVELLGEPHKSVDGPKPVPV